MGLAEELRLLAAQTQEAMQPVQLIEGSVRSISPLVIRLASNSKLDIPGDLFTIPKRLRQSGDDPLQVGDNVMAASFTGGQSFYIMDKI
ncbi:phage portal protein [Halalkalibacterium halodurans]|uniref:Phage portal protein n=1 Tax=Halalkalibacterium halodurans TaxID=86665 RepID=A0A0M0KM58_ALKHA|nr:phage portal protein [Halalkalibacterium halodurans]TPE70675.1 phage portal protein [Halalkalibacterium halodurans]